MTLETTLYLSAAFELGVFFFFLAWAAFRPASRRGAVVVLGALTPVMLSLADTTVRFLLLDQQGESLVFYGMWQTSLLPYAACLVFGLLAGWWLKRPAGLSARYIVGLVVPSVLAVLWLVAVPQ